MINNQVLPEENNPQDAQNERHYPELANETNVNDEPSSEFGTDHYLEMEVGLQWGRKGELQWERVKQHTIDQYGTPVVRQKQ